MLTLPWNLERLGISHGDLVEHTTKLVQHLEALLLPNARIVESRQAHLEGIPVRLKRKHFIGKLDL